MGWEGYHDMYSRSPGEVNSNSYVFATSKVNPKLERLLSKSLTTLEVLTYYLVVHTGQDHSLVPPWTVRYITTGD